jgi:DNA gyrase/topoisomerase IV subunit B
MITKKQSKKSSPSTVQIDSDDPINGEEKKSNSSAKKKPNGQQIKQISWMESVLHRGMWAGSKENQTINMDLIEDGKFIVKSVRLPPVLPKIIDEIVVNAIDHYSRCGKEVSKIDIDVLQDSTIIVINDGPGIPVEETTTVDGRKMYTPQLTFSEFMSGSNLDFEEDSERIVGGQNGIGAKLTSCWSKKFIIETLDAAHGVIYKQVFENNLSLIHPPEITNTKKKKPYTSISFLIDFERLKINREQFHSTLVEIVRARAYQTAAFIPISVAFCGEKIDVGFEKFARMYLPGDVVVGQLVHEKNNMAYDVIVGLSEGKERSITIMNGIYIQCGGTHIDYIHKLIVGELTPMILKEVKPMGITKISKTVITNNLFVFIKGYLKDIQFKSQVKDMIVVDEARFEGYDFTPKKFYREVYDVILPSVLENIGAKRKTTSSKNVLGRINPMKYQEARMCSKKNLRHKCSLIITEGDSAQGMVNEGINKEIDKDFNGDYFGSYTIQGVPINGLKFSYMVNESGTIIRKKKPVAAKSTAPGSKKKASNGESKINLDEEEIGGGDGDEEEDNNSIGVFEELSSAYGGANFDNFVLGIRKAKDKLIKNERIKDIMCILGLNFNMKYDRTPKGEKEFETLRYGSIIGMTDQDLDGFNIFGLISTFFLTFWPGLVERGFIRRINTPIVRFIPKKSKRKTLAVQSFYSEKAAKDWSAAHADEMHHYDVKYYKGLGTHTGARGEIDEIFTNISEKICTYVMDEHAIKNMFIYYGEETAPRKIVLAQPPPDEREYPDRQIPLSDHFMIQVRKFQRDNIIRKLLCCIDGFVDSRRKAFYTATFLRTDEEVKVGKLAQDVGAKANYHHGDASMADTIAKMAQGLPGARNMPLLLPLGLYGTRDRGYKNYAQPRYIYTAINAKLAYKLFRPEDNYILEYEIDNGERFEPKYYVPIIPYVLCESNSLPATGWRITVYARHIDDIFENTRNMITGKIKSCKKLRMWNKDFNGSIVDGPNKKKYFVGKYIYDSSQNPNHITILELPPSKSSKNYIVGDWLTDEEKKEAKRSKAKAKGGGGGESETDGPAKGIINLKHIVGVSDYTTNKGVRIEVDFEPGSIATIAEKHSNEWFDGLINYLGLKEPIVDYLNLVDEYGRVIHYESYEDIFNHWFEIRKKYYIKRVERDRIVLEYKLQYLREVQRFSKNHNNYNITNRTSLEKANEILESEKYIRFNYRNLSSPQFIPVEELHNAILVHDVSYDYLLDLGYKNLVDVACAKRDEEIKKIESLLEEYKDETYFKGAKIWLRELDELEKAVVDGLKSDWFYGENLFSYASMSDGVKGKKSASKRAK